MSVMCVTAELLPVYGIAVSKIDYLYCKHTVRVSTKLNKSIKYARKQSFVWLFYF